MKRSVFLFVLITCASVALAQLAIPETSYPVGKQNGWHLDSIQILFDGSDVEGLQTVPRIRAFFQGTYTDSTGTYALKEIGKWVELSEKQAGELLLGTVYKDASLKAVLVSLAIDHADLGVVNAPAPIVAKVAVPPWNVVTVRDTVFVTK